MNSVSVAYPHNDRTTAGTYLPAQLVSDAIRSLAQSDTRPPQPSSHLARAFEFYARLEGTLAGATRHDFVARILLSNKDGHRTNGQSYIPDVGGD